MRTEIRFGGFGGQGIISAGTITGKAASIFDDKNAVLIQSYGPEARGGACSAEVVVEKENIDYPQITVPDISILMSQEAYEKYADDLKEGGILILEDDLINGDKEQRNGTQCYRVSATKIAEDLGKKVVANAVMLGFLTSISSVISAEAMKKAIKSSVPEGTEELNERAFDEGARRGKLAAKGNKSLTENE